MCFASSPSSSSHPLEALGPNSRRPPFVGTVSAGGRLSRTGKGGRKTEQTRSKGQAGVAFSLLGPLSARVDGEAFPLGGARRRALLALLLLHANEPVSREQLIEGVWGAARPTTIGAALNVHLSKIRKLLAAAGAEATLVTEPHGYVLEVDPDRVDVHRFERLLREGREELVAGCAEEAAATLDQALALWRGAPLAELTLDASVAGAIGRLAELRLSGLEDRFEAELLLGRHTELVAELQEFVREQPLRERARAQLMLALYRSGRQSEALQAYRDARVLLAEELGLDPGPELRRLEKAILVQDASLAAAAPRRLLRIGPVQRVAAVLALILVVGAFLALGRGGLGPQRPEPLEDGVLAGASDVAVIRADTNKLVARVPVGSSPALIREGDGSVWVADQVDLTVTEIDPESRRVLRTIGVGFRPDDLAAADGAVWAFDKERRELARLGDGQAWDRFEHRDFAQVDRIALDDRAVWLSGGRRLIRVDASSGEVLSNVSVPVQVDGLVTAGSDVWAVSSAADAVLRLDPVTAEIRDRIPVAGSPGPSPNSLAISADADFVWVLNSDTATVVKIDPRVHDVVESYRLEVDSGSLRLAAGEGAAWVSSAYDGTLTRIDGETDEVDSIPVTASYRPRDLTVAAGLVWVSVDDDSAPQ